MAIQLKAEQPKALPGFEHVNRYWDNVHQVWSAKILPGEFYVSTHGEMIVTVLGSCISACIRDRVLGIGGMNHFMLPVQNENSSENWGSNPVTQESRYGNWAMEFL
ncbi:MAG: chemotaxis protein CheD, partial [Thalassolituus oleivorans]